MREKLPVYLTLGAHAGNYEATPPLLSFREDISTALEVANGGVVAVLMEYSNHSREAGLQIQKEVEAGERPSVAIINNQRIYNKKRHSSAVYRSMAEADFADGFQRGYRNILDGAFITYPGRLTLLPEWAPEDEINHDGPSPLIVKSARLHRLIQSGRYNEGFEAFVDLATTSGHRFRVREERVASSLLELVDSKPEIKAAVGYFGAFHTGLSKELRDLGFEPKRTLDLKFKLGPFSVNAIVRHLRFFPDRPIPESYWAEAYKNYFNTYRLYRSTTRALNPPS